MNFDPHNQEWCGAIFDWKANNPQGTAHTVWRTFASDTAYFAPSTKDFMLNFRVRDLQAMLDQLRANACDVDEKVEVSEYGKFGWVMDPEGNRIELWEPPPPAVDPEAATNANSEK
jgi:predicted enzyme related to lactoylglutathione lyase